MPFIIGAACSKCGAPLQGDAPGDLAARCDECLQLERPWNTGTAVAVYAGTSRRIVLALKHGDRIDVTKTLGAWMAAKVSSRLLADSLVVPIPIHRNRLLRRRFNQSALLAGEIALRGGAKFAPDALHRIVHTPIQDGLGYSERFELQSGAIAASSRSSLRGASVLLVDDVMTSGATLDAAAHVVRQAGAARVDCVVFARVAKPGRGDYMRSKT